MVFPIIFAAAAALFTGASYFQGRQTSKSQAKQVRLQRRAEELRALRERRQNLRSAQKELADVRNTGEIQGVGSSSGVLGGAYSVISQGRYNESFLDSQERLSVRMYKAADKAARSEQYAQAFGALANIAMTGYKLDKSGAFDNLFKSSGAAEPAAAFPTNGPVDLRGTIKPSGTLF